MVTQHEAPVVLAAFDFDGTLTRGDTLLPFLRMALGWPGLLLALLRSAPWLAAYAIGLMSNQRAKARLLSVCLRGRTVDEVQGWALRFCQKVLPSRWNEAGLSSLRRHLQDGHQCIIVSASPDIYLNAVARDLGVHDLICTEMEVVNGRLTGTMRTANCHGKEKARRLREWIKQRHVSASPLTLYAYGDSRADLPMLDLANYAFYRGQALSRQASAGGRPPDSAAH